MEKETLITFNEHLERIQRAKKATSLLEQMSLAEQSMGILWEQLFDQLCVKAPDSDLSAVKELTAILNKLLQAYRQLFALCQKINGSATDGEAWTLSETILKEIEEQLQML